MLHCPVAEAQARVDAEEFRRWMAAYCLSPWGEERDDLRAALQTMHLLRPYAKPMTQLSVRDYQLRFEQPDPKADDARQRQAIGSAAAALRAKKRRRLGHHR